MPPEPLLRLVGELFPLPGEYVPPRMAPRSVIEEEIVAPPQITEREMEMAFDRLRVRTTAPGPDGMPGRVLRDALEHLGGRLRELFDKCLSSGQFPKPWKEGKLVLLPKVGRPLESPSAYRPIHLEEVGPGLSEAQYGFRAGQSITDAMKDRDHGGGGPRGRGPGSIAGRGERPLIPRSTSGSPSWSVYHSPRDSDKGEGPDEVSGSDPGRKMELLRRPQRIIAVRAVRDYRAVSWTVATLLASDPPWELQAEVLVEVHRFRVEARANGDRLGSAEVGRIRSVAQQALIRRWEEDLGSP
ncbi:uncharacterized protein LOC126780645 [Nymphalis io]|uniref:uncharacterized protein LOC126780645 n=1 Tax=Inachis io TaxID=171585 RepID=UPI00216747BE|nr:uncharacterized protein LOC126780645 [Nymphalis io]